MEYSSQAKAILDNLKEDTINIEEFEAWVTKTKFIVGGGYIIEYLTLKSEVK